MSFYGAWSGLWMAGNSSIAMALDGVEVTAADRIGAPGASGELPFGVDDGPQGALVAIMEAKIAATEAALDVTQQAPEVCGGQGYTPALSVERHLRNG